MKIVRVLSAASLALLAAAAAPAKPPPPGHSDRQRSAWRDETVRSCVSGLGAVEEASAGEVERACGCAADRLAAGRPAGALPNFAPGAVALELRAPLILCAAESRPDLATAISARLSPAPSATSSPPAGDEAKPADAAAPANSTESAEAPKPTVPERPSPFAGFSLPAWLTDSGLPTWAWAILGVFAFLMLRALFRRGERRDLTGPPSRMGPGIRPTPPRPRAADPIRRS